LNLFVRFLKATWGISAVTEGSAIVFATPEVRSSWYVVQG
jgi:hypothetical protein